MNKKKTLFVLAAVLVGTAAAAVNLYRFTVGNGCLWLAWTGLPCPTCGMTRATLSFVFGRFTEAFAFHPLFWAPYAMVALGVGCIPNTRRRRVFLYCITALLAVFIAVWAVRIAFFDWRG